MNGINRHDVFIRFKRLRVHVKAEHACPARDNLHLNRFLKRGSRTFRMGTDKCNHILAGCHLFDGCHRPGNDNRIFRNGWCCHRDEGECLPGRGMEGGQDDESYQDPDDTTEDYQDRIILCEQRITFLPYFFIKLFIAFCFIFL